MTQSKQTVHLIYSENNRGTFRNQVVENVFTDDEGYAYGTWKGRFVAAYSLHTAEWWVM